MMHLAFIPFIIAICFHGGSLRLLGAILLMLYLADRFYFTTKMWVASSFGVVEGC